MDIIFLFSDLQRYLRVSVMSYLQFTAAKGLF